MKTKVKVKSYEEAVKRAEKHKKPNKPFFVMHTLIRILSFFTLLPRGFKYTKKGMDKISKKQLKNSMYYYKMNSDYAN